MPDFTPQVKRVGKSHQGQLRVALALTKQKRFDEALSSYEAILQSNPASKVAHLAAGKILFRQERYDEALSHFQVVMRLDPLMPRAPMAAGRVYLKQGNLKKAQEAFQETLNIDPKFTQAYVGLGQVLVRQEKYGEAIQQFRKALSLDPQLIQVRLLLAQMHQRQGSYTQALAELKSVLNIDPTKWRIHQALGRIYLKQKQYSAAREAFQEALKLNPELPPSARLGVAEALIEENHLDEATEILRQVPQVKPLEPKKHKLWGDIYQRQGLMKEAAEEYRAATLLAAEEGDKLDDLADLDALLEEDEDKLQEVVESYGAVADKRVSEAQARQQESFQERRLRR